MTLRVVAVADTHTFEGDFREIPDGDVFVHAGDLCRGGRLSELESVAAWISALPHTYKLVVPGNHDWSFVKEPLASRALLGESVTVLEDRGVEIEGVRFWGSPWQPEFHQWAFNLPRGRALAEKWALIPADTHVLVTHGPPEGIGDRTLTNGRQGCADLLARVRVIAPKLHMFGHIHEDGGAWQHGPTWFANVTTWECERAPTVFDVSAEGATPVLVPPRSTR
ncbi:MAG: metallophosphoesterase [Myxococcales bacterium]|nr:metallophosphoesterase [Myxococcales bacterium]